jgi:hypothetical protein
MRKLNILVLLTVAMLVGLPCLAATPVSAAKTKEYHEAYAAFNVNDLPKAYKILTALVARIPAFDAVAFLGQTELSMGKFRDAADHLTFAIENTPSDKAEEALPVLKGDLAEAKTHLTTLRITVDQPDADVALDGKILAKSSLDTDLFVDPGKHVISATHATLGNTESAIDTKAGEGSTIALKLVKPPPPTAVEALPVPELKTPADLDQPSKIETSSPPVAETKRGVEGKTIVLIAGGAVTLIAAGTATVFGLKAHSAFNDAESLRAQAESEFGQAPCLNPSGNSAAVCSEIRSKLDRHDSASRVFNVALPVSIGAAAATGLLYLVWPRSNTASTVAAIPVADSQSGGLLLYGSF